MARPRKNDDQRRSDCFTIRLTPDERLALQAEAARLRMSPTELARQRVLKARVVVREHRQPDPRLVFELNKVGVNLNQIARALNERQNVNPVAIESAIGELKKLIAALLIPGSSLPNAGDETRAAAAAVDTAPAPQRPASVPKPGAHKPHRGVPDGS